MGIERYKETGEGDRRAGQVVDRIFTFTLLKHDLSLFWLKLLSLFILPFLVYLNNILPAFSSLLYFPSPFGGLQVGRLPLSRSSLLDLRRPALGLISSFWSSSSSFESVFSVVGPAPL